jgi:hypothetical protein
MSKRVHYNEEIARTGTGDTYYQSPAILAAREDARRGNKNAIVLNPKLAAGPSVLYNEERDYNYTTNNPNLYQSDYEKNDNRRQEWGELTEDKKYSRQNRANVNRATLNQTRSNSDDDRSSDCNDSPGGCNLSGGKVAKKTKRKRSRRSKKSRRHRKK